MTHQRIARLGLTYLAISTAIVGLWAQFAPRSFYDSFPGLGRTWVALDGPYNEHLVRDVGGLNLALAIVLVAAAVTGSLAMIRVACLAAMAYGVPHLLYHLTATDNLQTSDVVAVIGGLALSAALPLLILWAASYDSPAANRSA